MLQYSKEYIRVVLGWGEIKKCSPMDSGILVEYADIYRRLLGQKNPGAYFIKLRSRGIAVLWYYKHCNGSFSQLQMGNWVLVKIFLNNAPMLLFNYALYI